MKKSASFTIACWLLLSVLCVRLFLPLILGGVGGVGVGLEGLARFISLGIIAIILIDHLSRFSFIFKYENNFIFLILSFIFLMLVQIFLVGNASFNLQGMIKYLFYFGFIIISLYGAIVFSDQSVHLLLNLCFFLFLSVLIFYPFMIMESGVDPITRLMNREGRMSFLLKASNEDAHFMTTLFMLVFVKVRKSKVLCIILACVFYLALIYNGTRSALMLSFVLPIVSYILLKRKFVTSAIIIGLLVLLTLPYLVTFVETKFEAELAILEDTEDVMAGQEAGGTLSWRIVYLWKPSIDYILSHSPVIGYGSNGWDIVIPKILHGETASPHNFFVWSFVNWGFVGVTLILLIIGTSIYYVWKSYLRDKSNVDDQLLSIALLCAWTEFLIWSMIANVNNSEGWTILCILIVFSICVKYKNFSRDLINTYEGFNHKHA